MVGQVRVRRFSTAPVAAFAALLGCGGLSRSENSLGTGGGTGVANETGGSTNVANGTGGSTGVGAVSHGSGGTSHASWVPGQGGFSGGPTLGNLDDACTAFCNDGVRLSCTGFSEDACLASCTKTAHIAYQDYRCANDVFDQVTCVYGLDDPCSALAPSNGGYALATPNLGNQCDDLAQEIATCVARVCKSHPEVNGCGAMASGSGGTSGAATGEAGAAATDTSTDFGDFDTPPDGLPPPRSGTSPTFYWGTLDNVHMANWFVVSSGKFEGDAHIDAIQPPRGNSTKACHVSGADFAQGADLYAQLNHPQGSPADLSNYTGLTFWARLAGSSSEITVALNDGTVSLPRGDDFSTLPSATFTATSEWHEYSFSFDPKRDSSVVSIDFVVLGGGTSLDLWVDEVTLLCRGECR